jgi:hypothetical protein
VCRIRRSECAWGFGLDWINRRRCRWAMRLGEEGGGI